MFEKIQAIIDNENNSTVKECTNAMAALEDIWDTLAKEQKNTAEELYADLYDLREWLRKDEED